MKHLSSTILIEVFCSLICAKCVHIYILACLEREEWGSCISNIPGIENPVQNKWKSTHFSRRNSDFEDSKSICIIAYLMEFYL